MKSAFVGGFFCIALGLYCLYQRRFLFGLTPRVPAGLAGLLGLMLSLVIDLKRREVACDRMMNSIGWTGTERVLDVGCGKGHVLLAAVKRLTLGKGRATGVYIWKKTADRQSVEAFRRNAVEGVADRIELCEDNARNLPFESGSFDVIFASLCLHQAGGHRGIRPSPSK